MVEIFHLKNNIYTTINHQLVLEIQNQFWYKTKDKLSIIKHSFINENQISNDSDIYNCFDGIYDFDESIQYIKSNNSFLNALNHLMFEKGFFPTSNEQLITKPISIDKVPNNLIELIHNNIDIDNLSWCLIAGDIFFEYDSNNFITKSFPLLSQKLNNSQSIDVYVQANGSDTKTYQILDNIQVTFCDNPIQYVCNFNNCNIALIQTITGESQLYYHDNIKENLVVESIESNLSLELITRRLRH